MRYFLLVLLFSCSPTKHKGVVIKISDANKREFSVLELNDSEKQNPILKDTSWVHNAIKQ